MIPTLLLAGLAVGLLPRRWAVVGVALLSAGWATLLLANGTVSGVGGMLGAAILGLANAAIGGLAGQGIRAAIGLTRGG